MVVNEKFNSNSFGLQQIKSKFWLKLSYTKLIETKFFVDCYERKPIYL